MLFNSIEFALFLPLVFVLYWFVTNRSIKLQNILLVVASYVFYGWWDWRFLSLIFFSSALDYFLGLRLNESDDKIRRKGYLLISLFSNLGLLGFFKYYNFFAESFSEAFTLLGQHIEPSRLNIILPVGISFYTFQTLSYTIDIYRKKLEPTKDPIAFFAFVSFFPQLVAGPIERAKNLLPQFYVSRHFEKEKAIDGLRQILFGLFKKVVIADNCARYVDAIFNNHTDFSGSTLFFGAVMFSVQIYGDFSGYSDIAIGTSRLFGFNLQQNFAFPYFSRDIAEFWRRWHISLSTWFRDYVYIPLGGSRGGKWSQVRNIFIIFVVSGFWHGANWTFIIWGLLNALYFLPLMLMNKNRNNLEPIGNIPNVREVLGIAVTFFMTTMAWIFFRAESIGHAISYLSGIFNTSFFSIPHYINQKITIFYLVLIGFLFYMEWLGKTKQHALEELKLNSFVRWAFYVGLGILIILFIGREQQFIYFQF